MQDVLAQIRRKKSIVGWEGLNPLEQWIFNQYNILEEYTAYLTIQANKPNHERDGSWVRVAIEDKEEKQTACVNRLVQRWMNGETTP